MTKRAALVVVIVAGGAGGLAWALHRGADPVYDDDAALAAWADRLAHPPSSVEVPVDLELPETSTGVPLRKGVPLPVDRSLHVEDPTPSSPGDAAGEDRFALVPTTSELLLTVSKRMVQFERRDVLPVPADPIHGFDARYKHSAADVELLQGAVAPLAYARQRAWALREKLGQPQWREDLLVMADRDLPCRLLAEVMFAAGALQFTAHVVGTRAGRVVDMGISRDFGLDWSTGSPRIVPWQGSRSEIIRVAIQPQTFELEIPHERTVDVDCERGHVDRRGEARFVTIARRNDGSDFESLAGCARRLEEAFDHQLVYGVAPAAAVSVQVLVSTVDGLRKAAARDVEIGLDLSRFLPTGRESLLPAP